MAKKNKKNKRKRHQTKKSKGGQTHKQRPKKPIFLPSYLDDDESIDELMDKGIDELADILAGGLADMTKKNLVDIFGDKLARMPINDLAELLANDLADIPMDELAKIMGDDLIEILGDGLDHMSMNDLADMPLILPTEGLMSDMPITQDGYRIVGPAQAMVDYAQPLMKGAESEEDINDAFQMAQLCWSLAISQRHESEDFDKLKKEAIDDLDILEPEKLIDIMIERFDLMFPELGRVPSFYVKERVIDVEEYEPFNESTLHISQDKIPPTEEEIFFAEDAAIIDPYTGESELLESLEELTDCYAEWCSAKGVPDEAILGFSFVVSSYLMFLRDYCDEEISANTSKEVVHEFMHVHFIRKTAGPVAEKTMMPCALKLFMQYLDEKGIISGTERVKKIIASEEDAFQKTLKIYSDPSLEK